MKRILAGACAFGLLACSPQAPAAKEETKTDAVADAAEVLTYVCPGGKTFSVTYDEDYTVATVKSGDATYKLPAVISGSGARYSDGKVEFWEKGGKGGEAMLNGTPDGDSGSCPQKEESK
jgi:membrane-bound inhibitor of C-type lysozyme